ncbi:Pentapeptide repeat-containing protein [Lentzea xinjiangensis]|uniref:Pentapeptide repeat-containing protein n=1 Tax=Lentzea xinjiangensis TaxID=402600 RepID=A0A1H9W4F5_9PSEU|nr:pentapeptide repeat-containing protein [Lentzea xinjiangensis]SES28641.1 Pentapeptide repeat-containing protein [Lentzea xinjiangensis]
MTTAEPAPPSRRRPTLDKPRPASPQPGPDEQLPWAVPVLGLVALVIIAGGALWATLDWLERIAAVKVDPSTAINGKDYVTAKLDAVKIALSVVAGGGALFALYLAVRRQRTAERDLRARLDAQTHTEDDARARRVTELFTKAADQLGSDKAPVRLAALYALERLGQDNRDQRATIASLWCAYLRMPYAPAPAALTPQPAVTHPAGGVPRPLLRGPRRRAGIHRPDPSAQPDPMAVDVEALLERDVRLSVQRLLAKHLLTRPDGQHVLDYWPEIPGLDLTEATLINFDLSHCSVPSISMDGATFTGTTLFAGTTFTHNASFVGATFTRGALFADATFTRDATFTGATFAHDTSFGSATFARDALFGSATFAQDALFGGATFAGSARFSRVTFTGGAEFSTATFTRTAWFSHTTFARDARFSGAIFTGDVEFGGAMFTGVAAFAGATFTGTTRFSRVTFTRVTSFIGATFSGTTWFAKATFTGDTTFASATFAIDTWFNHAVFASTARCLSARVRLPMERPPQQLPPQGGAWPQGWACVAAEPADEDAQWGWLLPVPVVLSQVTDLS